MDSVTQQVVSTHFAGTQAPVWVSVSGYARIEGMQVCSVYERLAAKHPLRNVSGYRFDLQVRPAHMLAYCPGKGAIDYFLTDVMTTIAAKGVSHTAYLAETYNDGAWRTATDVAGWYLGTMSPKLMTLEMKRHGYRMNKAGKWVKDATAADAKGNHVCA